MELRHFMSWSTVLKMPEFIQYICFVKDWVLCAGCQLGDALPEQAPPFAGLWPSSAEECTKRVMDPDYRYIQEFKSELEEMGKTHRLE